MNLPITAQNDVKALKAKGAKVYAVLPEMPEVGATGHQTKRYCQNCGGGGRVYISVTVGGPFEHCPATQADGPHVTTEDGKWYLRRIKAYTCPDCNGTGLS